MIPPVRQLAHRLSISLAGCSDHIYDLQILFLYSKMMVHLLGTNGVKSTPGIASRATSSGALSRPMYFCRLLALAPLSITGSCCAVLCSLLLSAVACAARQFVVSLIPALSCRFSYCGLSCLRLLDQLQAANVVKVSSRIRALDTAAPCAGTAHSSTICSTALVQCAASWV